MKTFTAIVTTPGGRNVKDVEADCSRTEALIAARTSRKEATVTIAEDTTVRGYRSPDGTCSTFRDTGSTMEYFAQVMASIGMSGCSMEDVRKALTPGGDMETEFPIARNTDPETSHIAAAQVTPKLPVRRRAILDLLKQNEGATANELGELFAEDNPGYFRARSEPGRRLCELERLGYAERGEPRKSDTSSRLAITWTSTSQTEQKK